jgi:ferredoxin
MPNVTVIYGEQVKQVQVEAGALIGEAVAASGLPLEQPCSGRGTCGKCKVLVEEGALPPDEIERKHLTPGELAVNNRLACRARVGGDARVVLAPIVVYSNKIFRRSSRYRQVQSPLGLAVHGKPWRGQIQGIERGDGDGLRSERGAEGLAGDGAAFC